MELEHNQIEKEIKQIKSATAMTQERYDRIAPVYDLHHWLAEPFLFKKLRQLLWSRIRAESILELGVGTGANMPYYPKASKVTAIDLSEQMLKRAKRRAEKAGISVDLRLMDAENLTFPANSFDLAVTTFVFCSVPDPVQGLRELGRVVVPEGDIWLMEHVRVDKPIIGPLMDMLNPLVVRLMGAHINRQTVENVKRAGLQIVNVEYLMGPLFRLIHARPMARKP